MSKINNNYHFFSVVAFFFLFFLHGFSIGKRQQGISYNICINASLRLFSSKLALLPLLLQAFVSGRFS